MHPAHLLPRHIVAYEVGSERACSAHNRGADSVGTYEEKCPSRAS
jgi:hypothetical protein